MGFRLCLMPKPGAQGVSEEALQPLHSAAHFLQRASKVAPGLDARLTAGPVIAAALQGIDPGMSRRMFLGLMPESASAAKHMPHTKEPLKRALFPEHQPEADTDGDGRLSLTGPTWTERAFGQISRHVNASNASQLASLIRSLPLEQALCSLQEPPGSAGLHGLPPLSQSSVLLAYLMKALPAPVTQADAPRTTTAISDQSDLGSHPDTADLAVGSRPYSRGTARHQLRSTPAGKAPVIALEEAYRRCRKHLRQLEAGQLAALLRFWLLQGPPPLPGIASSRPELRGAVRLRLLQDGVAAIARLVDKAPGSPEQTSEVSQ